MHTLLYIFWNPTLQELQSYWWFIISLLGGLLVFLLFVQGGQSLLFTLGKTEMEQKMIVNSTGRKWEFTFTTLVTFGGAFFASFPLFYSTSFGGAYWIWMLILLCFVIQAVSYEYQAKKGNLLGKKTYQIFLVINGIAGPILLGTALGTFFTGAEFIVNKEQITQIGSPVISSWANPWHGLEAALNPWNVCLGLAVFFLSRVLAILYFQINIRKEEFNHRCFKQLRVEAPLFLLFFLVFLIHLLLSDGFKSNPEGIIDVYPFTYLTNLTALPVLAVLLVTGIIGVLWGILLILFGKKGQYAFWLTGGGTVLAVLALLLCTGWNNTAYYPSTADMQSSLTIQNSSSSLFTLKVMTYVSLLIPFVLTYIYFAWKAMDAEPIGHEEMSEDGHSY